MKGKILIVDDEIKTCEILKVFFEKKGYRVNIATSANEGLEKFKEENPHLVISDVKMPQISGIELLKKIKGIKEDVPVILITAYGDIKNAVEAMKEGAYHYILKPYEFEEIEIIVERAIRELSLKEELKKLKEQIREKYNFENIIGKSKKMLEIFNIITQIADTDASVLITGETGTGKELVARAIHYNSKRKNKPFLAINCAAVPPSLLESELFGYCKGAFTDAYKDKEGYLEIADGGTLFLDEISEMNFPLQIKLLRVLENNEFMRLGGTKIIKVDVRFISATNQNLKTKIEKGEFREDLYYRLNVVPINIPPLRERKEDIPLLVTHFLNKYNQQYNKNVKFSERVFKSLLNYDFPGNVRELENIVERSVILATSDIINEIDLFTPETKDTSSIFELDYHSAKEKILLDFEKKYFKEILKRTNNNITQAAKLAKIHRVNLSNKIKELGLK
jgi:DNA-binding NtrC family response regulator